MADVSNPSIATSSVSSSNPTALSTISISATPSVLSAGSSQTSAGK